MKLWIDAAAVSPERVFGMSLIERHLKAARHQQTALSEVIVDVGAGGAQPDFVLEKRLKAPVRIVQTTGTAGERLAAALGDQPLLATDAATVVDARLYGYLGHNAGSRSEHRGCGERAQLLLEVRRHVGASIDDLPAVQPLLAVMPTERTLGALLAPTPYLCEKLDTVEESLHESYH